MSRGTTTTRPPSPSGEGARRAGGGSISTAPGSFRPSIDRWGQASTLLRDVEAGAVFLIDRRVARLHPKLTRAIAATKPRAVIQVTASEELKSLSSLGEVLAELASVPRGSLLVAVGGGTVGDVAAVAAHLARRGLRLWQVPTTLLAAADSSLGGKGALNIGGVKNSVGVFHYAERTLLCPELFETLPDSRWREGALEALKLELCSSTRPSWPASWRSDLSWVRRARKQKAARCAADPYETNGVRAVLNFGHTFGHALEAVSDFALPHGEAVGLGILCALDVGVSLGVTPLEVARKAEVLLEQVQGPRARERLAKWLGRTSRAQLEKLIKADKKATARAVRMILLRGLGDPVFQEVADPVSGVASVPPLPPFGAR
ncbi:MAG: 3-dehydroquinate synthase family protein [Myxococcaceae bacterium]